MSRKAVALLDLVFLGCDLVFLGHLGTKLEQSGNVKNNLVPGLLKWSGKRKTDRINELMDMMGLDPDLLDRYPSELSGGQQQRIGVARALAADPPVVLLDEPFGALDPLTREKIRKEFKQLESLIDKTMIMVTHDVSEALELGNRICLLDRGQIQQIGTPRELIFKPANAYVKTFFASHRFQLEMQVLTLKDLIPFFESSPESESQMLVKNQEISVWDSLNELESRATIRIVDDLGQVIVDVDSDDIMPAFQKSKNQVF